MNLSGDIVKAILQGSSNIFLVESSSDGSGLPRQWKDHPAWMRLCPVFEAATTGSPSALGSASVGLISRSLAGNGLDGLFVDVWEESREGDWQMDQGGLCNDMDATAAGCAETRAEQHPSLQFSLWNRLICQRWAGAYGQDDAHKTPLGGVWGLTRADRDTICLSGYPSGGGG